MLEEKLVHYSYIMYTWPGEEDGDPLTNLINKTEELKRNYH
jgi:hypothetical protein